MSTPAEPLTAIPTAAGDTGASAEKPAPEPPSSPPLVRSPSRRPSPARKSTTHRLSTSPAQSPERATEDKNASEAETDILSDAAASGAKGRRKICLENGVDRERGRKKAKERRDNDKIAAEDGPRKKRRRSVSKPRQEKHRPPKGGGDDGEDGAFSSDLSSALSSRHVSPSYLRRKAHGDSGDTQNSLRKSSLSTVSRKRKAPADAVSSSDDEHPPPKMKVRHRRTSTADSSSLVKSSPFSPPRQSSPNRSSTKNKSIQAGQKKRIPPPLITAREKQSDEETSSTSSRQGSPARSRRLNSAARTPGSPINMSHRPKRDTAGRTHLHRACGKGSVAEVESILEQGTELINAEDNAGYLPIHEASLRGYLEVVKVLVKYGAAFDVQSRIDLESPLLDAVENGHFDVVEYLLGLGADPRKRDKQGRSCLDAIRESPHEDRDEVEEMLKQAASKQKNQRPSDDEMTRGSVPADRDSHSSRDASVASPPRQSPPASSSAPTHNPRRRNVRQEQSRKDLLWLDSGKGSVIKLREKAREGDLQMVHALLETGLKPDNEALVGAIKGGHTELVSLLLAYQADADPVPGQIEKEGSRKKREVSMPVGEETPMLAAIGRGNVTILKYLLANGVDAKRLDSRGRSYADIAREREGELWQEEVQLLKDAWQKDSVKEKSPQRLKSSAAKAAASAVRHPRRSSSTSSRAQSRSLAKVKEEKPSKRSLSAHSGSNDSAVASDRESTAEPLGPPPKTRATKQPTSVELATPSSPRRRRRLVSGKVRDEEAKASAYRTRDSDADTDRKPLRSSDKSTKPVKSEADDTIRVENQPRRVKREPVDDAKVEDAPPLERRKLKMERERERERERDRERSATRKASATRERPNRGRSRSPPRAPRTEAEGQQELDQLRKRKREDHPDDHNHRRKGSVIESDPRRSRDERRPLARRASVSSEAPRRRDDSRGSIRSDGPRPNDEDRRRRIREREGDKEATKDPARDTRNSDTKNPDGRERKLKEKPRTERDKPKASDQEEKPRPDKQKEERSKEDKLSEQESMDEATNRQLDAEAHELLRQRHLTRELASILKKASKESAEARENQAIERGLELRKILHEQEEKEREKREAMRKAEQLKQEQEERERLEREAAEREAREKEEAERLAKEQAERERIERETKEREAREAEERRLEAERQAELERQRKEEERVRREQEAEAERKRLATEQEELERKKEAERRAEQERLEQQRLAEEAEKRKLAEEERKRRELEKEKAEKEIRDRKIAEELQRQLAQERRRLEERAARERARIASLPFALREAANNTSMDNPEKFLPLFVASLENPLPPATALSTPNGVGHTYDKWISNVQASLVLGTADLDLSAYQIDHRPTTEHERLRIWSAMNILLCENPYHSEKTLNERIAHRAEEKRKFLSIGNIFWIRLSEFIAILSDSPRSSGKPPATIEIDMQVPTRGEGSPLPPGSPRPTTREMRARLKRRLHSVGSESPDSSPLPKSKRLQQQPPSVTPPVINGPTSMHPPPLPPQFGIS